MNNGGLIENKVSGRSSSQISIYDYPEHLNPFYEDENHKRLRFWKIGGGTLKRQKSGRSNSFSLDGLKDMWAFKTFKLKKKSSTLGINKTSESPPMLRRDLSTNDYQSSTYDPRRHTDFVVSSDSSGAGLNTNFQRGAGYRTTYQDNRLNKTDSDIGFIRNNRYRSTVQNGSYQSTLPSTNSRYQYRGSVTPTPQSRYTTSTGLTHGISQSSLNSTNPFDEDDDNISTIEIPDTNGVAGGSKPSSAGTTRVPKKKRKAPAPPPPPSIHTTSPTITQSINSQTKTINVDNTNFTNERLFISEEDETTNIKNLTEEIETFVKIADTDNECLRNSPEKVTTTDSIEKVIVVSPQSALPSKEDSNTSTTNNSSTITTTTTTTTTIATVEINKNNNINRQQEQQQDSRKSPENNEDYPDKLSEQQKSSRISPDKLANLNESETIKLINNKQSPVKIIIRSPTGEDDDDDDNVNVNVHDNHDYDNVIIREKEKNIETNENVIIDDKDDIELRKKEQELIDSVNQSIYVTQTSPITSTPICNVSTSNTTTVLEQKEMSPPPDINEELKIIETNEDDQEEKISTNKQIGNHHMDSDRYRIRFIALKTNSPMSSRRITELKQQSSQPNVDEKKIILQEQQKQPPAPPERRRSVKDIIASINKCQSLLKINQQNKSTVPESDYYVINNNNNNNRSGSIDVLPQDNPYTMQSSYKIQQSPVKGSSLSPETTITTTTTSESNESIIRNINELSEAERQIKQCISEMEQTTPILDDDPRIPLVVERFNDLSNNEDIFKKCTVNKRTKIDDENYGNNIENRPSLEWNPLPKPRRSRNLSHELPKS